jgi:hypothetical protein
MMQAANFKTPQSPDKKIKGMQVQPLNSETNRPNRLLHSTPNGDGGYPGEESYKEN